LLLVLAWIPLVNAARDIHNKGDGTGVFSGGESSLGERFELRLSIHEEWLVAQFLIQLSDKEPGMNVVHCSWTERANLIEQGLEFLVPNSWKEQQPPKAGTFCLTYFTESVNCIRVADRRALAEKYCGWLPK